MSEAPQGFDDLNGLLNLSFLAQLPRDLLHADKLTMK
jgi:hypothetical protein